MKSFLQKYWLVFFSSLLVFIVAIVNKFPLGYSFAGGDFFHYFNYDNFFQNSPYLYLWSNLKGSGYFTTSFSYNIYYFIFWMFSFLNLDISFYSVISYIIYLGGSFFSFLTASKYFLEKNRKELFNYRCLFATLYTFNPFTFFLFYQGKGFTPFLFLYILIPCFFALAYVFFKETTFNKKYLALLGIFGFLGSVSFGANIAFLVALLLGLFLFILLLKLLFNYSKNKFLIKFFSFFIVFFLSSFFQSIVWVLKFFQSSSLVLKNTYLLDSWVLGRSIKILNLFLGANNQLIIDSFFNIYWPVFLVFFGFLFLIVIFFLKVKNKTKKIVVVFVILFLFFVFLLNKGKGIFPEKLVLKIFNNPVSLLIRSEDKLLLFLPYFLLQGLFVGYKNIFLKRKKIFIVFLFLSISFLVLPFCLGRLQTKYSQAFNNIYNYQSAEYSYLVKIPQEYKENYFVKNKDLEDDKILSWPYSVVNSAGWANYPKWKFVGVDPIGQFFLKPIISPNDYLLSFEDWSYGEVWNYQSENQAGWLLPFSGLLNSKYLMLHLDVHSKFVRQVEDKFLKLMKKENLKFLEGNKYYKLFELPESYYLDHVYVPGVFLNIYGRVDSFPDIISQPNYQVNSVSFFNTEELVKKSIYNQKDILVFSSKKELLDDLNKEINNLVKNSKKIDVLNEKQKLLKHYQEGKGKYFSKVLKSDYYDLSFQLDFCLKDNLLMKDPYFFINNKKFLLPSKKINNKVYKLIADKNCFVKLENLFLEKGEINIFLDYVLNNIILEKAIKKNVQIPELEVKKINLTKYTVGVHGANSMFPLIFSESFHKDWRLQLDKEYFKLDHFKANGYANGWWIDVDDLCKDSDKCVKNEDGSYDFELIIEFWPQRLFYLSLAVSGLTLLGCFSYLIYIYKKRKNLLKKNKYNNIY